MWCGMVCGMVWCGVVFCGMVWYGIPCNMVLYGAILLLCNEFQEFLKSVIWYLILFYTKVVTLWNKSTKL